MTAARQADFFAAAVAPAPLPASFATLPGLRPAGGFRLLLADPPWSFENYSEKGEAKNAKAHYACLPAALLLRLPVAAVAAEDAVLALWCTFPLIFDASQVIAAWGFRYAGLGWVWRKTHASGKHAFGPGYGTRKNLEPLLLARRGQGLAVKDRAVRDFLDTEFMDEAPRQHSRKPDRQYELLQKLYGDVAPRLELFARQARPGWVAWGDQVSRFAGETAVSQREAIGAPIAGSEPAAETTDDSGRRAEGAAG